MTMVSSLALKFLKLTVNFYMIDVTSFLEDLTCFTFVILLNFENLILGTH